MLKRKLFLCLSVLVVFFATTISFSQAPSSAGSTYRGDINDDGRVNILDLLSLLRIISSGETGSDRQRVIANVDKSEDGRVNIFDLLAMLKILSGLREPDLIIWGPPAISSISPAHALPGDTVEIILENMTQGAGIRVLLNGIEIAPLESGPEYAKLVLPEGFIGGAVSLVVDGDTTGSRFVNLLNTNPPVIAGCQIFPADNPWNQPVEGFPVHPNSDNYIEKIGQFDPLHPDVSSNPVSGIPYTVVGGDQPRVPVKFNYWDESDPGPYPIPENAPIEGGPSSTGDRHILVLDSANCTLYETFSMNYEVSGWKGGSGAIFDLASNALRPDTWTSADAAGLSILAGLVRYDEVAAGEVNHAIRFTVEVTQCSYVYPATHFASRSDDPNLPPMGLRFRLKADYDISRFTGQARIIARALQKYGIILADNGGDWYISGAGNSRWNNNELEQLKSLHGYNFEVVDVSAMAVSGKEERYNIRPAVEVTAPAEGASFSPGADFKITAEAYDNDGSVALVEFFQDDTKLGEDDTSPYEFTWSSVPAGTYSITARAVDNGGAVNTSCHVTITVGSGI